MTLDRARASNPLPRQLAAGIAAVAVVQLLLLQPGLGRMLASPGGMLALCVAFGLVAFVTWLATGVRWPLVAWAIALLIVAIDQTQPIQSADRDAFGDFADGATVPAPLLSAHAPERAAR